MSNTHTTLIRGRAAARLDLTLCLEAVIEKVFEAHSLPSRTPLANALAEETVSFIESYDAMLTSQSERDDAATEAARPALVLHFREMFSRILKEHAHWSPAELVEALAREAVSWIEGYDEMCTH
jgi:hypothetical protein